MLKETKMFKEGILWEKLLKKGMVGLCFQMEDRIVNNSKGSRYDVVRAGHGCVTTIVTQGPTLRGLALGLMCCHHHGIL